MILPGADRADALVVELDDPGEFDQTDAAVAVGIGRVKFGQQLERPRGARHRRRAAGDDDVVVGDVGRLDVVETEDRKGGIRQRHAVPAPLIGRGGFGHGDNAEFHALALEANLIGGQIGDHGPEGRGALGVGREELEEHGAGIDRGIRQDLHGVDTRCNRRDEGGVERAAGRAGTDLGKRGREPSLRKIRVVVANHEGAAPVEHEHGIGQYAQGGAERFAQSADQHVLLQRAVEREADRDDLVAGTHGRAEREHHETRTPVGIGVVDLKERGAAATVGPVELHLVGPGREGQQDRGVLRSLARGREPGCRGDLDRGRGERSEIRRRPPVLIEGELRPGGIGQREARVGKTGRSRDNPGELGNLRIPAGAGKTRRGGARAADAEEEHRFGLGPLDGEAAREAAERRDGGAGVNVDEVARHDVTGDGSTENGTAGVAHTDPVKPGIGL